MEIRSKSSSRSQAQMQSLLKNIKASKEQVPSCLCCLPRGMPEDDLFLFIFYRTIAEIEKYDCGVG